MARKVLDVVLWPVFKPLQAVGDISLALFPKDPWAPLLVYDKALPEQPYMVALPRGVLRAALGELNELRAGRMSLWVAARNGETAEAADLSRDERTTRTPAYVKEFMELRADRRILSRKADKARRLLMMGAAVAIVVTTMAGLILTLALTT